LSITKGFIDLHLHLDGSISIKSARELAVIENIELTADDEILKTQLMCPPDCKNLEDYLSRFTLPCSLLQSKESLELAAYNLCTELKESGYIYAEIRFAPQKHCNKGLTQDEVVSATVKGIERSGFKAQLILCCMREFHDNTLENLETIDVTHKYLNKGVCACDLAGAEAPFANGQYAPIFEKARQLNLPFTLHAGEALGADSVTRALDYGARRIGHGVRSFEDPEVVKRLADLKIPLEICPTSNINTVVFDEISQIPIPQLEEAGVIVTINSDNMSVSNTNVKNELDQIMNAFGYNENDIYRLLTNSINAAFLTDQEKSSLLISLERTL